MATRETSSDTWYVLCIDSFEGKKNSGQFSDADFAALVHIAIAGDEPNGGGMYARVEKLIAGWVVRPIP